MRSLILMMALLTALAAPAQAAEEWGVPGEKIARFEAKVVDILCELTGNCPEACGAGARQLGLLKDDGTLVLAIKNNYPFTGATRDLTDFCGKRVVADGLMIENRGTRFFNLQFVRLAPDGKWRRANRWIDRWAADQGVAADSETAKQWFRNDPTVKAIQKEEGGKLGIPGLKAE
ncbi:MAG: hypothetical protein QF893_20735 [Alphaproteobacteria bacterium]|jgi:hypothetical protein|nr:hypothetical protein [Alphaproteobacteria bacterium]